jgi:K+-sensing histidine kinase KdpD
MNLVNNALTKDGNVTTKTKLESLQNGKIVSFKIIDTGIGIPKDKLETVLFFTRLSGNKPQILRA